MTTETERPLPSLLGVLLFVLAASVEIVGINALMMPYRTGGGMFLGWLLCLIALAVTGGLLAKAGLGSAGPFFLPYLLLAFFSCLYGIVGGQIPRLLALRETPPIPVAEASQPAHQSSHVFQITDGHVLGRHHGTRRVSRKMNAGRYHVAPIIPEGWKESDPVPAWAVGEGKGEFPSEAWRKAVGGGYRCIADATYRDMIEEGRLKSVPGAPLLVLDEHPREALLAAARFELWWLLAAGGLSLLGGLLPFVRRPKTGAP